jgi:hypothetical protein
MDASKLLFERRFVALNQYIRGKKRKEATLN